MPSFYQTNIFQIFYVDWSVDIFVQLIFLPVHWILELHALKDCNLDKWGQNYVVLTSIIIILNQYASREINLHWSFLKKRILK